MRKSRFHLRLRNEQHQLEFTSTHALFRSDLNDAFMGFQEAGFGSKAWLEVYHDCHGWNQVYFDGVFTVIGSPLTIDYIRLRSGIYQTLQKCDQWPTEEQRLARINKLRKEERERVAASLRRQFTLVK